MEEEDELESELSLSEEESLSESDDDEDEEEEFEVSEDLSRAAELAALTFKRLSTLCWSECDLISRLRRCVRDCLCTYFLSF